MEKFFEYLVKGIGWFMAFPFWLGYKYFYKHEKVEPYSSICLLFIGILLNCVWVWILVGFAFGLGGSR
jgi:hypothetical protein